MITKKDITDAYVFLRTKNNSIPDEVLDFIKDAALEKLKSDKKEYNKGFKEGFKDGIDFAVNSIKSI